MSKHIRVPFVAPMISAIIEGRKSCTSRTYRLCDVDDFFYIRGKCYVIVSIVKMLLGEVAEKYYKKEGVSSIEDFISLWNHIYPMKEYDPKQMVFVHFFKEK